MTSQDVLADRYGSAQPWRRRAVIAAVVVVVAASLGWLGWTIWDTSTPKVQSQMIGFTVVDEHSAVAKVDIHLTDPSVHATCTLRAYAEDHTVVGELPFTPEGDGTAEHTIRTERLASSVELIGCTAPGQNRPR